jgi:hypothetical protein
MQDKEERSRRWLTHEWCTNTTIYTWPGWERERKRRYRKINADESKSVSVDDVWLVWIEDNASPQQEYVDITKVVVVFDVYKLLEYFKYFCLSRSNYIVITSNKSFFKWSMLSLVIGWRKADDYFVYFIVLLSVWSFGFQEKE